MIQHMPSFLYISHLILQIERYYVRICAGYLKTRTPSVMQLKLAFIKVYFDSQSCFYKYKITLENTVMLIKALSPIRPQWITSVMGSDAEAISASETSAECDCISWYSIKINATAIDVTLGFLSLNWAWNVISFKAKFKRRKKNPVLYLHI